MAGFEVTTEFSDGDIYRLIRTARDLRNVRKTNANNPDESNANVPGSGVATGVLPGPGVVVPPLVVITVSVELK